MTTLAPGHRFPGGSVTVEHWENVLFHHASGIDEIPRHGHVHPASAFHVPIRGGGVTIQQLFDLVGAVGVAGVGLDFYAFDFVRPWMVDDSLDVAGTVEVVEPTIVHGFAGPAAVDRVTFRFDLSDGDGLVLRSRISWIVYRPDRTVDAGPESVEQPARAGEVLASQTVFDVSPDRMRLAAALLRDPYPIHWDVEATDAIGLGKRVVNQTPLNVSYLANVVIAQHGPGSIASMHLRFPGLVFGGDDVVATAYRSLGREVEVVLDRDGHEVAWGKVGLR